MDYTEYGEPANFTDANMDAAGMQGSAADMGNPMADPKADAMAAQREQVLRQILTPEARMRLGNIRMVKPDVANIIEQQLVALATQGRIQAPLTDAQLRQMLSTIQQPKREFKFNRV